MTAYVLLVIMILLNGVNTTLSKKFQIGIKIDFLHYMLNSFFGGFFACIIFGCIAKFQFEMNGITFIFSIIFAIIVVVNLVVSLLILKNGSVAVSSMLSTAGNVFISALLGIIFLRKECR